MLTAKQAREKAKQADLISYYMDAAEEAIQAAAEAGEYQVDFNLFAYTDGNKDVEWYEDLSAKLAHELGKYGYDVSGVKIQVIRISWWRKEQGVDDTGLEKAYDAYKRVKEKISKKEDNDGWTSHLDKKDYNFHSMMSQNELDSLLAALATGKLDPDPPRAPRYSDSDYPDKDACDDWA